ncbi:unnamed protein product [Vitrella brassicaformis CCMP3155]|uniref:Uncharacterized protein n=2 Tax=Vitrella brassicaformis TaxID=1169539 RepID=A0A0G4FH73_VITBC|nr:unnamed protein product [Vitrella brassicaformis CCMP3155]|eukprot:CEM12641.1 unnamed protein product [Vitrella brassicaformis CCMP3155]
MRGFVTIVLAWVAAEAAPSFRSRSLQDLREGVTVQVGGPFGPFAYVNPRPSATFVSPLTTIALRAGAAFAQTLGPVIEVVGDKSGVHKGKKKLSHDNKTLLFEPQDPLAPGELVRVTVSPGLQTEDGKTLDGYTWQFRVTTKSLDTFRKDRSTVIHVSRGERMAKGSVPHGMPVEYPGNYGVPTSRRQLDASASSLDKEERAALARTMNDLHRSLASDDGPLEPFFDTVKPHQGAKLKPHVGVSDDGHNLIAIALQTPIEEDDTVPNAANDIYPGDEDNVDGSGQLVAEKPGSGEKTTPPPAEYEDTVTYEAEVTTPPPGEESDRLHLPPAHYKTLPATYPEMNVTVAPHGHISDGYLFVSNIGWPRDVDWHPYLMILKTTTGEPVWYKELNPMFGWTIMDFKKQVRSNTLTYHDVGEGTFVELDDTYTEVRQIFPGHGYWANPHGFQLKEDGSALIMIYDSEMFDLSGVVDGGKKEARVAGAIVQEIDPQGNVVFEWRSWDYMPDSLETTEAKQLLTEDYVDHIHMNAIDWTPDGNILISFRHFDQAHKVDRTTGKLVWRFGGKDSDFKVTDDLRPFSHQHDVRISPDGKYITLFDNGNQASPQYSRAVMYAVDQASMTAEKVWEVAEEKKRFAFATGSVQHFDNGNFGIAWGGVGKPVKLPVWSEVDAAGNKLVEFEFVKNESSYRALKLPWTGRPVEPPTLVLNLEADPPQLHYSWNGATEVAQWRVYQGPTRHPNQLMRTHFAGHFEHLTVIEGGLPPDRCWWYQAEAIGKHGEVLARSNPAFGGSWGFGEC